MKIRHQAPRKRHREDPRLVRIGVMLVNQDYVPNMQDAYDADTESGAQWLNDQASVELCNKYPTVVAMAGLIEKERNKLKHEVQRLQRLLSPKWKGQ